MCFKQEVLDQMTHSGVMISLQVDFGNTWLLICSDFLSHSDRKIFKWTAARLMDRMTDAFDLWPSVGVISPQQLPHIWKPLSSNYPRVSCDLLRVLCRLPRGPHTCTLLCGLSTKATGIQQKGEKTRRHKGLFVATNCWESLKSKHFACGCIKDVVILH